MVNTQFLPKQKNEIPEDDINQKIYEGSHITNVLCFEISCFVDSFFGISFLFLNKVHGPMSSELNATEEIPLY